MQRYSKKRQSIIECVKNTKTHPTAEWVYNELKPLYKDLSLATVYRNINELVKSGKINSLGTVLDKERFDGDTTPHAHAVCARCGKIIDVTEVTIPKEVTDKVQDKTEFKVTYSNVQFVGICSDCIKDGKNDRQ